MSAGSLTSHVTWCKILENGVPEPKMAPTSRDARHSGPTATAGPLVGAPLPSVMPCLWLGLMDLPPQGHAPQCRGECAMQGLVSPMCHPLCALQAESHGPHPPPPALWLLGAVSGTWEEVNSGFYLLGPSLRGHLARPYPCVQALAHSGLVQAPVQTPLQAPPG